MGLHHDTAARTALHSAQALGTELALAGCFLQAPNATAAPFGADGDPAALGQCTATMH